MTYVKENPPVGAPLSARQAYLERELSKVESELIKHRDVLTTLIGYRIIGGINVPYFFDDTGITNADPGTGKIRGNAIVLSGASEWYVSKIDGLGRDLGDSFLGLAGQPLVFTNETGAGSWLGAVDSVVDQSTYVQFNCTIQSGSGNPSQDDFFTVQWYPSQALVQLARFEIDFATLADSRRL